MAYSTIPKGSLYMNTKLWTGNSTDNRSITGVGFQPDWVWIKERSATNSHSLFDAVRGANKQLQSNADAAQYDFSGDPNQELKSFTSDGFTLGTGGGVNNNSDTYVGWNWKAGTTSVPSGGSITPSAVSINTTSGFGIYTYPGNSTSGATIAHGLGIAPQMLIIKRYDGADNWVVGHESLGWSGTNYLNLNLTNAAAAQNMWNNDAPTSTLIRLGNYGHVNGSGDNFICYAFAPIKGYSKFGSYKGNGNSVGPMIFTGFKSAFIMLKKYDAASYWSMMDNKRPGINPIDETLKANATDAESDIGDFDFLSNGFKIRATTGNVNSSGYNYIYMAFASNPFVATSGSDAIPVTAE